MREPPSSGVRQQFTAREVLARYPALQPQHLRWLAAWKLIRADRSFKGAARYSFQDLSVIRQAAAEIERGVPFRVVLRSIHALRTGQLALDFRGDAQPARVVRWAAASPDSTRAGGGRAAAEHWFRLAVEADESGPERQAEALLLYRRSLEADPEFAPALVNLGNVHHARGDSVEAEALYRLAARIEPSLFEAHFNLGNVHHDRGRFEEARASYERALALSPGCAAAHLYLAVTLEKLARPAEAQPHWRAYLQLAPDGEWSGLAREFVE